MRNLLASLLLIAAGGLAAADVPAPAPAPVDAPKPIQAPKPALTLEDLPEAVRAAVLKQADGTTVEKIRADERGGEKVYTARWTKDSVRHEVRLASDGRLLKLKAERKGKDAVVTLERLPEAVRNAVNARLAGGQVIKIEQEEEKGKMVYSVEIARAADRLELEISAEGTILDEEVKSLEGKKEKGDKAEKGEKPAGETGPKPAN